MSLHSEAGKSEVGSHPSKLHLQLSLQLLTEIPALHVLLNENTCQYLAEGNSEDVSLQYKWFPWWEQLKKLDTTGASS